MSGSELVKFLESIGYRVTRTRGSHVRLVSEGGQATTIPIHAHRQLPKGLLHSHHSRAENDQDRFFQDVGVLRKDVIIEHLELLACFWFRALCSKSPKQPRTAIQRLL